MLEVGSYYLKMKDKTLLLYCCYIRITFCGRGKIKKNKNELTSLMIHYMNQ